MLRDVYVGCSSVLLLASVLLLGGGVLLWASHAPEITIMTGQSEFVRP